MLPARLFTLSVPCPRGRGDAHRHRHRPRPRPRPRSDSARRRRTPSCPARRSPTPAPAVISGDVGVSPGNAVTGFPPGLVDGRRHPRCRRRRPPGESRPDDGATTTPRAARPVVDKTGPGPRGPDAAPGRLQRLDLDGPDRHRHPRRAGATRRRCSSSRRGRPSITASNSTVSLIGAAQPCNVFWQVGSSATLGTGLRPSSAPSWPSPRSRRTTGATIEGRLLARNGAGHPRHQHHQPARLRRRTPPPATGTPTPTASPSPSTATHWRTDLPREQRRRLGLRLGRQR